MRPPSVRSIRETALAFDRACKTAKIRYALVGGFAVMAWGQPRMTLDVDALVAIDPRTADAFEKACKTQKLRVRAEDIQAAISEPSHVTIFDDESSYHIDVKPARTASELAQIQRAQTVPFLDGVLMVARPEDTIAFKLAFGSPHDIQDARSILVRQEGALDLEGLREIARSLGVLQELERLIDKRGA